MVVRLALDGGVFLTLEAPRKTNEAKMSLPVEEIFEEFLGKTVKITIEELEK